MKVIVDIVVWSLAFRRNTTEPMYRGLLTDLILDGRVVLLGVVRQEVLSGIRHTEQYERLKQALRAFPNTEFMRSVLTTANHTSEKY